MISTTSRKWSERDYEYITKNIAIGTQKLAEYFGVSDKAMQKRLSLLKLIVREPKAKPEPKEVKMDNTEKFNPKKHKIKNNSTVGKIPFEIKSERMIVYLTPEQNNDKYKQSVVNRYATRHKPIV